MELFFERSRVRQVLRRLLIEHADELLGGGRNSDGALANDSLRFNLLVVDPFVAVVVRPKGGAFQRDSCKQASSSGVGQNFGPQGGIRGGFGVAALGASGGRSVCAEFDLTAENRLGAARVHNQEDEVGSLATKLEAHAATFEGHHGGCAPRPGEMFTAAAGHGAAAVTAADNESGFEHGRENNDALGFVEQVRGNVIGDVQNFLENGAAIV